MGLWTVAAKKKVSDLIRRENFKKILDITSEFVYIDFGDDGGCKVDVFGRVEWFDD